MSLRRTLSLLPLSVFLFVVFLPTSPAIAQTTLSGAVAGTALDAQRAAIANAQITLQSAATGELFTTRTGPNGAYRIVELTPGSYSLTAASPGFADVHLLRVTVEVGRTTEIEIPFAVAPARETVVVRDEAPAVNTTQSAFATNISDAAIESLPSNNRRWSDFALLTPTATLDGDYGLISFRGISGLMNNSTVDGADNNQAFFSEERGRTRISYVISQAAVQEFQVNTSNFSSQYGRAAGSVVNALTRSGTNDFHGSAFYYMRDNALGAANPFTVVPVQNPSTGAWATEPVKPLDRRQQFGGTFGGPILHDKLFFFTTFDAQRRDFPAVAAAENPTTLFAPPCVIPSHYGALSGANRALVQQCYTDDSSRDEIYALTRPFGISDTAAIAGFYNGLNYLESLLGTVPRSANHQIGLAKLDYHLNPRNTVSLLYNRQRFASPGGTETDAVSDIGSSSFGFDGVKTDTLIARLTSTLGHSFYNELRYSWSRDFEFHLPQTYVPGEPANPGGLAPSVAVLAGSSGFTFGTPTTQPRLALPDEFRNQLADTISWVHRRHIFKFGFDANRVVDQMNNLYAQA